jgi:ATP-dependent DNA helicase PIF1
MNNSGEDLEVRKLEPWEVALKALQEGRNVLLTGGAGTGKSFNLRKLIEYLEDNEIECARTAMTGMASLQMIGGETVHSCFKTGIHHHPDQLGEVVSGFMFQKETIWRLRIIRVIIIDEISMMRSDFLELLDAIMKYVHGNDRPFGGVQVIFSGDFMQLPPVVKDDDGDIKDKFWAFESPVWEELKLKVIYLREIKRQDDPHFANALNMVRAGAINQAVNSYFFDTHKHRFPAGVEAVKLMSTNKEVESSNLNRLLQIQEEDENYKAEIWAKNDFLRKKIIQDVVAVEHLRLRKGCQVMILVNKKGVYVNGSMGIYEGKHKITDAKGLPVEALAVRLFSTGQIVYVEKNEWAIEKAKKGELKEKEATFRQFPVKLGYAITIHKSQGMTIDYLEVNLGRCFADGMAYVALSRAKNYEGLRVLNWSPSAVKCNTKAFNFYMNLKNNGVI